MSDECTNITTIEELSVFCHWKENGVPVESFLEIVPFKKADAEGIYLAIIKKKTLQISNIVGMGFDGASTFSGKKTGVQARLKKHSPHIHRHCHMLQSACVQASYLSTATPISLCASCQWHSWNKACVHYPDYTTEVFSLLVPGVQIMQVSLFLSVLVNRFHCCQNEQNH